MRQRVAFAVWFASSLGLFTTWLAVYEFRRYLNLTHHSAHYAYGIFVAPVEYALLPVLAGIVGIGVVCWAFTKKDP